MVLQSAYSALERFRISRTFFVKTDQADCNVLPDIAADPSLLKSTIEVSIDAKNVHPIPNVEIPIEVSHTIYIWSCVISSIKYIKLLKNL